ncbi:hypothetical protein NVP1031O_084 [Vibrio phage 1.031.O._10N.261.46.F8]|nr:hypothetical protein NVP1031O_084 [Vibrio phage 1.031.O._10N.261.46.F8]
MQLFDIDYKKVEEVVVALQARNLSEEELKTMSVDQLASHVEFVNSSLRPLHVMVGALQDHTRKAKLMMQDKCVHPGEFRQSDSDNDPHNPRREWWCSKCGANI